MRPWPDPTLWKRLRWLWWRCTGRRGPDPRDWLKRVGDSFEYSTRVVHTHYDPSTPTRAEFAAALDDLVERFVTLQPGEATQLEDGRTITNLGAAEIHVDRLGGDWRP